VPTTDITGLSAQDKDIESKIKKDNAAFEGNNLLHKNYRIYASLPSPLTFLH